MCMTLTLYFCYTVATWAYVMYLTVQTSFHWMSNNTFTDVKIVKFNESNSPCLAIIFKDLVNVVHLKKCPSNWKVFIDDTNGEREAMLQFQR